MGGVRHDGDFSAYTTVRWPAMLRTLVLLGCPRAAQVVQEGLARCYPRWGELRERDDPDVHVYRTLLEEWQRETRRDRGARPGWRRGWRAWRGAQPVLPLPEPVAAPAAPDGELLPALATAVADLDQQQRAVVVLRFAAHLEDVQVADVLDLDVDVVGQETARALSQLDVRRLERSLS